MTEQRQRFETTLASIPDTEITAEMREFRPRAMTFMEFFDENISSNLELHLNTVQCTLDEHMLVQKEPLFMMIEGNHEEPLYVARVH